MGRPSPAVVALALIVACAAGAGVAAVAQRRGPTRPHAILPAIPRLGFALRVPLPHAAEPAPDEPPLAAAAPPEMYREQPLGPLLVAMATQPIDGYLGRYTSTSAVYRLRLQGGTEIGFKPALPGQWGWWRHEVLAFHLAHILGLTDRVPPVVARAVPLDALGPEARHDDVVTDPDDRSMVLGAAIFWLPVLRVTHLDLPRRRAQWAPWLDPTQPVPSGADLQRAIDLSTVLVFDYLQGNEDRWNEANIAADETDRVVFRDNNVGWFAATMRDLTWGEGSLHNTRRFSRSLIDAVEHADREALAADLAREPVYTRPLPEPGVLDAYEHRRARVLEYVAQLRARYGDESVLAFP